MTPWKVFRVASSSYPVSPFPLSVSPPFLPPLSHVQAVSAELRERAEVHSRLEADSQALGRFLSSGESARVRARLTQTGRYWEELRESVQQLQARLEESFSHQQKFNASLEEVGGRGEIGD